MLSTESRIEMLLSLNILIKKAEKETRNLYSNLFGYMPLLSISKQADNLKWLEWFLLFVLFQLNIKDKKRYLI